MKTVDLETIFSRALRIQGEEERHAYVRRACGKNKELYAKVSRFLQAHEEAGAFLPRDPIGSVMQEPSAALGTSIDHYKLLENLGEGGFGQVYVAEQSEPVKRRVALKIIKLGMDTKQVVARFEAERQALAMMDHPNIAKVHDAGATETGRPYFVMELVNGIPITDYCGKEKLDTKARLDLFIKVCHAVQHAHQKGIIHRDLKPSNILVESHDGVPVPKVIDFGIAKATHQELTEKTIYTKFQEFIGTPSYMSPEQTQLSGLDIDTRSDVYSLGVLLYELLTGSTPFDSKALLASGFDEMRKIIREKEPVRPSTRLSQLRSGTRENRSEAEIDEVNSGPRQSSEVSRPPLHLATDLDWIVMKCLAKERARRYETATGLATDLVRHLKHEPIVARPPSKSYRLQKSWQRNKLACTAGMAVALALIAGFAVSTWQARVATRSKAIADEQRYRADDSARDLQHNLAGQLMVRGQTLCEQGKVASGLHWMVRAIEAAPPESEDLKRAIENNLVAWSRQWVEPKELLFHESTLSCGAFSPDGEKVITGSKEGWLTLWSMPSKSQLWQKKAHDGVIETMVFSSDGTRVLTNSSDDGKRTARLWDTATGHGIGEPIASSTAVFSPDGRLVLAGGEKKAARLYSAETGDPLGPLLQHDAGEKAAAFSPDSKLVLIGYVDGSARFWDVQTGKEVGPALLLPADDAPLNDSEEWKRRRIVMAAAFSPNGENVATSYFGGSVRLWSVRTGELLVPEFRHDARALSLNFSQDGERLLTASTDNTARLWDTKTGGPIGRPMRHHAWLGEASFNPDGSLVLTGMGGDGTARLWSAQTGLPLGLPMRHRENVVWGASFSPDGNHILSVSEGLVAQLWDVESASSTAHFLLESGFHGTGTASLHPTGKLVATGARLPWGGLLVWDVSERKRLATDWAHPGGIHRLRFSPDGGQILTAGYDGTARLWDVSSRKPSSFILEHDEAVHAIAYSNNGQLMATGSQDRTARIWRTTDGSPVHSLNHPNSVDDLVFSPDGSLLLTACGDGTARVWSVDSGQEILPPLHHGDFVTAVDFSPDGHLMATGGKDDLVKFWSLPDGQPFSGVLSHEGEVGSVKFSPDGRLVMTTSRDYKVRLWSPETATQIGPALISDQGWYLWEADFSSDGERAVIADYEHGVRIVELPPFIDKPLPNPRLWIEVITRMAMDEHGTLMWIEPNDWQSKREQLAKLQVPLEPQ